MHLLKVIPISIKLYAKYFIYNIKCRIFTSHLSRQPFLYVIRCLCTINSKINGTPKGVYLPISKLHSILALANLHAHNNIINNFGGTIYFDVHGTLPQCSFNVKTFFYLYYILLYCYVWEYQRNFIILVYLNFSTI